MAALPITHTRKDTFVRDLTFKDANGAAIDLTGAAVAFTLKRDPSDATPLATAAAVISAPLTGVCRITVAAATMDIPEGVYSYDVQLTDAGGEVTTVLKGPFSVTYNVTA